PDYDSPLDDVLRLFELARTNGQYFPDALAQAEHDPAISTKGKAGIALLHEHLAEVHFGSRAWTILASYLFVHSNYLTSLLEDKSVHGQQRRLAIYQLLRFASEYRSRLREGRKTPPGRQF